MTHPNWLDVFVAFMAGAACALTLVLARLGKVARIRAAFATPRPQEIHDYPPFLRELMGLAGTGAAPPQEKKP